VHRNVPLTPTGRLRLARCVVEDGWPLRRAAERFQVAVTTGEALGRPLPRARPGRDGRPFQPPVAQSTPHFASAGATDPGGAPDPPQRPALIGFLLRIPPSTVHRALTRYASRGWRTWTGLPAATRRTVTRP